jgi:hypothetical protein
MLALADCGSGVHVAVLANSRFSRGLLPVAASEFDTNTLYSLILDAGSVTRFWQLQER